MIDYAARAIAYARRVVEGDEAAGKFERLACQRFLRDLERQRTEAFPYYFDDAAGARACRFIGLLPHIKGEWAKPQYRDGKLSYETIRLEDWQVFQLMNVFGWRHMTTLLRRFMRWYEEVARKNAKSTLAAGVLLFMTTADAEPGAHCYSAATTGDQAREVFDVARNMATRSPEFLYKFGVDVGKHDISVPRDVHSASGKLLAGGASTAKPLNAEGSTLDGLNVHFANIDELHAHKTRAVLDVIDSATGARSQPLVMMITTAGSDTAGVCYEQRDYTIKVLEGTVDDESWFGVIFALDDADDWQDERTWRKANPNLGISVKLDDMRAQCRKALAMPAARNNFLTKRLNKWVNADTAWMDMLKWQACADPHLSEAAFAGARCYIGLDLAEKRDFAAKVKVFERDGRFALFVKLYLNRFAVAESSNAHMAGWAEAGHVQVNDGDITDFDAIAADLRRDCETHDVQEIAFDPALSRYFASKLVAEGLPMVEIRQAPMFYTQPLIQVTNLVHERKLVHEGNPAMTWMISNVVVTRSKLTGLMHPTKSREENKIDGPVAGLMALGRALLNQSDVHGQAFVDLNQAEAQAA